MKKPRTRTEIAYALQFLADYDAEHLDAFSREVLGEDPAVPAERLTLVRDVLIALYEALADPAPALWERVTRAHRALEDEAEPATAAAHAAAKAAAAPCPGARASPWAPPTASPPVVPIAASPSTPWAPARGRATAPMRMVHAIVTPFVGGPARPPEPIASALEPHPELGGTVPLVSRPDTRAALAHAERVVTAAGVSLRLDSYARICALQAVDPTAAARLWVDLGVPEEAARCELDARWRYEIARAPELLHAWRVLCGRFARPAS
jgi:hypothetical protein